MTACPECGGVGEVLDHRFHRTLCPRCHPIGDPNLPPLRRDGIRFFYVIPKGGSAYQMWRQKSHFTSLCEEYPYELMGETKQVAFLMDTELGVMLKHGTPENVQGEFRKYVDRGVAGDLDLMVVAFPEGYDPEEINRCISTSGYLMTLARREGLLPPESRLTP